MTQSGLLEFDHAKFDAQALEAALHMAEDLARIAQVAQILLEQGRRVDLAGYDRGVGLLCAKVLDLPPNAGRGLLPVLAALLAELDALTSSIAAQCD